VFQINIPDFLFSLFDDFLPASTDKVRQLLCLHLCNLDFAQNLIFAPHSLLVHHDRRLILVVVLTVNCVFVNLHLPPNVTLQLSFFVQVQFIWSKYFLPPHENLLLTHLAMLNLEVSPFYG
jgi:hypothetical protein